MRAGIRCRDLLLGDERTRDIPIVLVSAFMLTIPKDESHSNVVYVEKDLGSSRLITAIRGLLEVHAEQGTRSKRVFVVHGHDDEAKETVARWIETLDLQIVQPH